MEKDEVYPSGWKHRTFFGSRNARDKKPRIDLGSMEQQVLMEQQRDVEKLQQQEEDRLQQQEDKRLKQQEEEKLQQLEDRMRGPLGGQNATV